MKSLHLNRSSCRSLKLHRSKTVLLRESTIFWSPDKFKYQFWWENQTKFRRNWILQKIMLEVLKSPRPASQSFCLSFHAACLLTMDLAEPAVCVQRCHPRRHTLAPLGCILGLKVMMVPDQSLGDLHRSRGARGSIWAGLALTRLFIMPCALAKSSFLMAKHPSSQNSNVCCNTHGPGWVWSVLWGLGRIEKRWDRRPGCAVSCLSHIQGNAKASSLFLPGLKAHLSKIMGLAFILSAFPLSLPVFPHSFLLGCFRSSHLTAKLSA